MKAFLVRAALLLTTANFIASCGSMSVTPQDAKALGAITGTQDFECIMGRRTWLGNLHVNLRVTGQFDPEGRLGRVRIARLPGAPVRYDVVAQSAINKAATEMFQTELLREDGAAFYQAYITVLSKRFAGPIEHFTVIGARKENFYEARYTWRDLHQNETAGVGACHLDVDSMSRATKG
ncbi:MAG: hypothetical protein RIQ81_679 [Pseudomonadota bacterium]|jgi:hypothetical protein